MMSVVLYILLCILAELSIGRGLKHDGKFEAVATDQNPAELAELPKVSTPDDFLQMRKTEKRREEGQSVEAAFTTASQLLQQAALPNTMQQGSPESLAQVRGFLRNLASINQKLAEDAGDGSAASNIASDGNEDALITKAAPSPPATEYLLPDSPSSSPGGRGELTFTQQSLTSSGSQQDEQQTQAAQQDEQQTESTQSDSVTLRPYTASRASPEKPSLIETRASNYYDRPSANAGKADIVHFGLYGKLFYGTDLKKQQFTIDNVMTLQWVDARAATLVPSGQDSISMSAEDARLKIWLPEVEISNKVDRESNLISSSFTISKDGTVTLVERSFVVIRNKFELEEYPFDQQTLRLTIASEKYMINELTLLPLENSEFSGLRNGFFDDEPYEKVDFSVNAYDDVDGLLKKSRGYMEIVVERSPSKYQHSYLFPALLYSAIACGVFWLPFSPAFVVPRLALSILILLVFSNFAITADSELPEGAPYNWIDLICFTVQLHMFTVICLNIFTEVAYHTMSCKVTAIHMNNELKLLSPLTISVAFILISIGSSTKGALNLKALTILIPILLALFLITYALCCASTLGAEVRKHKLAESQQWEGQYGGGGLDVPFTTESLGPAPQPYVS